MKNIFTCKNIIRIVIGLFGIVILILLALRKEIFPAGSFIATLYDADVEKEIAVRLTKAIVIIIAAVSIYGLVKFVFSILKTKSNKAKTVIDLGLSLVKYLTAIVVIIMVLSAFGVDTDTLIASAGVLSLIIGLGCQTLISDIVAGLFIVFEGDFQVGDIVVISGWRGTVTSIGIRTTKITDASGNVKIVNNSNISDIVNNTKELSIAVCTCGVDYNDSIERIEKVISVNLAYMRKRIPAIIDGPFYKGVEELGDSAVVIKLVAKCKEEDKYQVQRDMNRELKIIFDNNKVNIPFPQVVVNQPTEVVDSKPINMDSFVDKQKVLSKGIEEVNG